ncbi:MAG: Maf family protein [Betaproteobacteria bacterium]
MTPPRIHLASRSPRRQELLRQLGVEFDVLLLRNAPGRTPDVVEEVRDGEPPRHYVERIARTKASVGWERVAKRKLPPWPVLGADTEVVVDEQVLGKPADAAEAAVMLSRLAGRTHEVLTGVALRYEDEIVFAMSASRVRLVQLSRTQVANYVETGEWTDKAGGYAIQGRAAAFIEHIEGSYSGVMGLPLFETASLLARVGFPVL